MITLLDGKALAASLQQELKAKVGILNITPTLGVILVGGDPASHLYVKLKQKAAAEVGIKVERIDFPENATANDIIKQLEDFNQRPDITGILVQFPLPTHLNEDEIMAAMSPAKDADGFHPQNINKFLQGQKSITPGVSEGIMKLIDLARQPIGDKQAVILANSQTFALPLEKLLLEQGVTTTVLNQVDKNILLTSDIIVVAVGKPNTITSEMVKDGAIIIDVGTTKVDDKVVGDVDVVSLQNRDVYLTPVPGGVGPMTVAMLLWNVYKLASITLITDH